MEQIEKIGHDAFRPHPGSVHPGSTQAVMLEQVRPQTDQWPRIYSDSGKVLSRAVDVLVEAYLDSCLERRNAPLKEFMDDLEKKILLSCLHVTHGSQRNAAALLGIKPTALFEKMRKHYINGRRIKLLEKLTGGGQHLFT